MEIKASARHIRMSPRKVRLVSDIVRGMDTPAAQLQLQFVRKLAAKPVLKLLLSAMANAEYNFKLDKNKLYIKSIVVDGGPMLKRFRARAFGRAAPIRKRSCHINIVLDERQEIGDKKQEKSKKSRQSGIPSFPLKIKKEAAGLKR